MSASVSRISSSPMVNSTLFILLVSSFLIIFPVVSITAREDTDSHTLLESSCSTTRFHDICYSSITAVPGMVEALATHEDVIQATLNLTKVSVEHNFFKVGRLFRHRSDLFPRAKIALYDCVENMKDTLRKLFKTVKNLNKYPLKNLTTHQADDLKTLISAAMTNQESCLDGISHGDTKMKLSKSLIEDLIHVYQLLSNSLGMIQNMMGANIINVGYAKRPQIEECGFPAWLREDDRRILQSSGVNADVVVAADGSGDYTTVQAAVDGAPNRSSTRYVIRIRAGVYRENVQVSGSKTHLMFVGEGSSTTIITASRSVGGGDTTYNSATAAIVGDGFLARDITFQNAAGPSNAQAVALRVNSDLSAFYRCSMIGYQDTLYTYSQRQFYRECFISGTVDFIFGNAAAILQDCDIHPRVPLSGQENTVTAQGRSDPDQNTGIVIQRCRIRATRDLEPVQNMYPTFLGRPWRLYSRTVVMQTVISDVINPRGWLRWDDESRVDLLYYAEYNNTGAGSSTANRVDWPGYRVLTSASQAEPFTSQNFIDGADWLDSTGFPYSLGL